MRQPLFITTNTKAKNLSANVSIYKIFNIQFLYWKKIVLSSSPPINHDQIKSRQKLLLLQEKQNQLKSFSYLSLTDAKVHLPVQQLQNRFCLLNLGTSHLQLIGNLTIYLICQTHFVLQTFTFC